MLTLNEIRNVNFRKANIGGYRAEDVEAFIDEVQLSYDTLLRENAELVKKLEVLAAKLEEYQSEEDSIRSALMNAQKVGDASMRDAKHKAEIILKDATIKAEKIVANAQSEIHNEREIIERMQRDIAEFKAKLLRAYKEHLTLINGIPNEDIMRPETREMVDSVQMLDRRAEAPNFDRQPTQLPTRPQAAPVSAPADEPVPSYQPSEQPRSSFAAPEPGPSYQPPEQPGPSFAAPEQPKMTYSAPEQPAKPPMPQSAPTPVMPSPERASQRKGGFTVDVGDDAPDSRSAAAPAPAPRRESRFNNRTFEDEVSVSADTSQFADLRVNDPGDSDGGVPASLFRKRR